MQFWSFWNIFKTSEWFFYLKKNFYFEKNSELNKKLNFFKPKKTFLKLFFRKKKFYVEILNFTSIPKTAESFAKLSAVLFFY